MTHLFTYLNSEFISDALNGKVLAERLELVTGIPVVLVLHPLPLDVLQ